jgi:hypothetical protein
MTGQTGATGASLGQGTHAGTATTSTTPTAQTTAGSETPTTTTTNRTPPSSGRNMGAGYQAGQREVVGDDLRVESGQVSDDGHGNSEAGHGR